MQAGGGLVPGTTNGDGQADGRRWSPGPFFQVQEQTRAAWLQTNVQHRGRPNCAEKLPNPHGLCGLLVTQSRCNSGSHSFWPSASEKIEETHGFCICFTLFNNHVFSFFPENHTPPTYNLMSFNLFQPIQTAHLECFLLFQGPGDLQLRQTSLQLRPHLLVALVSNGFLQQPEEATNQVLQAVHDFCMIFPCKIDFKSQVFGLKYSIYGSPNLRPFALL